jgi:hypothetical protein
MGRTAMAVALAAVMAAGCAGFEFYTDAALKGEQTGIKFYTPKPYLLVGRVGGDSKPVEVSVVYLPDLSQPYYAKARSGWGSSNLTMTLADGRITQFGQQVDNNGAATLTALQSLITALGGDAGAMRLQNLEGRPAGLEFSLYEIDTTKSPAELQEVTIPKPLTPQRPSGPTSQRKY